MKNTRLILALTLSAVVVLPAFAAKPPQKPPAKPPAKPPTASAPVIRRKVAPAGDRIDQAVNRLLKQADVFWHEGNYEAVGQMYYIMTDLDPTYLEAWRDYGWLLWSGLQRDDAAMRVFQRGLAFHPDTWELYFEIGFLEQHKGQYLSAAQWYARAVGRNAPRHVWHARAHALEYAGLVDKSKATWRQIIAKFPDNPVAGQNLKRLEEGRVRKGPSMGLHTDQPPAPPDPDAAPPERPVRPDPDSI